MGRIVAPEIVEDFNKFNEDPNKTVEQFVEDMNALYTHYNIYRDDK